MVGVVSLRGFAFAASMALIALPGESWAQSRQGDWAAPGVNCADIDKHADERLLRIMSRSIIWYEATCKIIGEKIIGNRYTLQTLCDAEGQKERRTTVVDMLPNGDISIAGVRYRRCPFTEVAPPSQAAPPQTTAGSQTTPNRNIEGGGEAPVKPNEKLTKGEQDALGELIAIIGKPKNDAEAVAQNTVVIVSGGEVCGFGERVARYRQLKNAEIQGAMAAGFGPDGQHKIDGIVKGLMKWMTFATSPRDAQNALCKMVDGSLAHEGF